MITIQGYSAFHKIHESDRSIVYRAHQDQGNQPVILKMIKNDYPSAQDVDRYQHEYKINSSIQSIGVIRAYDLIKNDNRLVIVFEDSGGNSLDAHLKTRKFSLQEVLKIAISLTESLGEVHSAHIIHKDLNPSNIIFNQKTGQVKIIDFGLSSISLQQYSEVITTNALEGTLAYISPEQTGRMNRPIDYRSDFYSLGATIYELLVNKPPFISDDSLELIHCHIAKLPTPLSIHDPNIPKPVSDIVMKLLEKAAENRYQSSRGIKADLQECLDQINKFGTIEPFPLAQQDFSEKFLISSKIYGRDSEIKILMETFNRVSVGWREMVVVSGYSGVGKTSLIRELYRPVTHQRGYFITGKYEQFQRNIPYSALTKAFQELMRQILAESEENLSRWREKLLSILGNNGQIIIDIIPEVELIIGSQPPVPKLDSSEVENRFNLVFQNFIQVFCGYNHPLVLFLDDLQWVDSASLRLLEMVLSVDLKYFLLIGAYRSNDVEPSHPLLMAIDELHKKGVHVSQILLNPLNLINISQLINDSLQNNKASVEPLSALIEQKTGGNPFFISEFLKTLYAKKLLKFNNVQTIWEWDLAEIKSLSITDNVVDLLSDRIKQLNENAQRILRLAACIGAEFDTEMLMAIAKKSKEEIFTALNNGLFEGLIIDNGILRTNSETGNAESINLFAFAHDRIQQAAYYLIPDVERTVTHWNIGQHLLKNTSLEDMEHKIFSIASQLNHGIALIQNSEDRYKLIEINLHAGKKAKDSAAYAQAFQYLRTGLRLLINPDWQSRYDLVLNIYTEAVETAYLCGEFDQMEELFSEILGNITTLLDKVKIYEVKIQACMAQNKLLEAIHTGQEILRQFGERLPESPNKFHMLYSFLDTRLILAGKKVDGFTNLPLMTDPNKTSIMRILSRVASAAYFVNPELLALVVFKQVKLSIKYGNAAESPFAYATYGLILCGVAGDIELGNKFGALSLNLLEDHNTSKVKTRTLLVVNDFIKHWKTHLRETLEPLRYAYQVGLETGDFEYAAYSIFVYSFHLFYMGKELPIVEKEMISHGDMIKRLKQESVLNQNNIFLQTVLNLEGLSQNICCLKGERYNEDIMLPIHIKARDKLTEYSLNINKLYLCFLFGEYRKAIEISSTVEKNLDNATGLTNVPIFYYIDSLARLAIFNDVSKSEQRQILRKVAKNQKKMKKWSHHAPMNHLHRFYLVEAERMRVSGRDALAMDLYDQAISSARENEFLNDEALSYELAAQFYLSRGKEKIAKTYLLDARYAYGRWGAVAKVNHIDTKHQRLLYGSLEKHAFLKAEPSIGSTISSNLESLDLASVMKSSQAISGEIRLDRLLDKLMGIVIENAGAMRGMLILKKENHLIVENIVSINRDEPVQAPITVDNFDGVSKGIVHYVSRTGGQVILDDAANEGAFTQDQFILNNQSKSILCLPVNYHGELIGLLYLENNQTTGAFTPDRVKVLNFLASQAAISIENAKIYAKLEESENKFRSLYENALEGIFQAAPEGHFINVNPSMAKLLGYDSPRDLLTTVSKIGKELFFQREDFEKYVQSLHEKDSATGLEAQAVRKDGSVTWVSISSQVVRDKNGNIIHYEGSLLDISQRKEKEKAERERETAEATARAKSEFLANMSHEIRTPMNAIIGFSNFALQSDLVDMQKDYVKKIKSAAGSLMGIINDIMDFSKIESGKMELEHTEFQLYKVLEDVADLFATKAAEKGIELIISVDDDVPSALVGDPTKLRQILINLTGNAMKFTEKGEIIITVSLEQHASNQGKIRFSVADTGIGISQEVIPKLFSAFTQADSSTTRKYGGTGLGLSICKRLVGMMNGDIGVSSEVGRGSTFSFTTCFDRSLETTEPIFKLPEDVRGVKALVVSDNQVCVAYISKMLHEVGCSVIQAFTADEALEKVNMALRENDPVRVLLMDWKQSPGIDGVETAKRIRNEPSFSSLPIVIMTVFSRKDDVRMAKEAGIHAFLSKPIKKRQLLNTVLEIFTGKKSGSDDAVLDFEEFSHAWSFSGKRVLVAEDNDLNLEIATAILKSSGITVDIANNGREAIDAINNTPYDAVFMDIQMPEMDGFQAAQLIRQKLTANQLPIIAMTANALSGDKEKCLEAGMNDYVTKPIESKELFTTLAKWVKPAIVDSAPSKQPACEELPTDFLGNLPGIHVESGLARVQGNKQLFFNLLKKFSEKYEGCSGIIKTAIEKGDMDSVKVLIHSIKGESGNLSANALHMAASDLEQSIKRNQLQNDSQVREFENALNEVLASIKTIPALSTLPDVKEELAKSDSARLSGRELQSVFNDLNELVKQNSLDAMDYLVTVKREVDPQYHEAIGLIEQHLNDLKYDEAQKELTRIATGADQDSVV